MDPGCLAACDVEGDHLRVAANVWVWESGGPGFDSQLCVFPVVNLKVYLKEMYRKYLAHGKCRTIGGW